VQSEMQQNMLNYFLFMFQSLGEKFTALQANVPCWCRHVMQHRVVSRCTFISCI